MENLGALAALAQYDSCSSSEEDGNEMDIEFDSVEDFIKRGILNHILKESVRRVEYAKSISYRNHDVIEIDEETSSSDDESSSSGDSDSDDDFLRIRGKSNAEKPGERRPKKIPPKVKGELLLRDLPPIEDLHITVPEYECLKIGTVTSIVDEMVVVQTEANTPALDLDTVLFLEKGQRTLGKVFDVMGPVMQPFYCVRFNSKEHVKDKNVAIGMAVFFAPRTEHTSFVFLAELMKLKGSDASWENDHEPPACHLDFSDDDEERQSKRSYIPPTNQARSSNAFYRRERRYEPKNYGPIQWNSVHVQHIKKD